MYHIVTTQRSFLTVALFFDGIQLVYVGWFLRGRIGNWIFRPGKGQVTRELRHCFWPRQQTIDQYLFVLLSITHQGWCLTLGVDLQDLQQWVIGRYLTDAVVFPLAFGQCITQGINFYQINGIWTSFTCPQRFGQCFVCSNKSFDDLFAGRSIRIDWIIQAVNVPEVQAGSTLQEVARTLWVVDTWQFDQDQGPGIVQRYVWSGYAQFVDPLFQQAESQLGGLIRFLLQHTDDLLIGITRLDFIFQCIIAGKQVGQWLVATDLGVSSSKERYVIVLRLALILRGFFQSVLKFLIILVRGK